MSETVSKNMICPKAVFCPKCGEPIILSRMISVEDKIKLAEKSFADGGKGKCKCGIVAVLAVKEMPESPTYSLFFNVYITD